MEPWIKLYRKFREWEWYNDPVVKAVFIELLLTANWKPTKWKGIDLDVGETVIGRKELAEAVGVSEQNVRTALKKLEKANTIVKKSTNKYTVVKVLNYCNYQGFDNESQPTTNQQLTNNQPTTNQQLTTIEEYKNIRNKEYIISSCCNRAEEIFGRTINTTEVNLIKEWLEEKKYNEELIKEAMRLTVVNGKKYLNYTTGILQNWEDRGYKTLNDIKENNKEIKESVEIFDCDWLNEEEK